MSVFLRALVWLVLVVSAVVIVRHHVAYLHRRRPYSFGAFIETAGWIILLLVALGAQYGGLGAPGTRTVEIAAAAVAFLFIGVGSTFQ